MKLLINGLVKYIVGFFLVGALVFVPAGTLHYTGGWLFMGLLFIPILILGAVLNIKAPDLLEKRLDGKEKERTQKGVVLMSAAVFVCGFAVAGLDRRFGWSEIPLFVTALFSILFLASYVLYAEVMRENAYLSRKIEVQEGQRVVDTGLYGVVRHPMYAATVIMFLSIPVILGSWFSLLCFFPYPVLIGVRINNEEKVLSRELSGYKEYKKKVKYRLIPFVW